MMKKRAASSMLVMFVAVSIASICQELVPPIRAGNVKAPFLLAVVSYYGMRREVGYAVIAAVWCAVVNDGLGMMPWGVSLLSFGAFTALCRLVFRRQMADSTFPCMIAAVAGGVLTDILQYAALRASGLYDAVPFHFLLLRLAVMAAAAFLVTGVVAGFVRYLDYTSSNAGFENDGDTFSWDSI